MAKKKTIAKKDNPKEMTREEIIKKHELDGYDAFLKLASIVELVKEENELAQKLNRSKTDEAFVTAQLVVLRREIKQRQWKEKRRKIFTTHKTD